MRLTTLLAFAAGAAAGWYAGRHPAPDPRAGELGALLAGDAVIGADPGVRRWDAVEVAPGPHPGSAQPLPDGGAPADEYTVKAAGDRFHTTESPHYPRVRAELWFRNAADAERAGLVRWDAPEQPG